MATAKTVETNADIALFIESLADEKQRKDSYKLVEIMSGVTGLAPKMWGPAIIGFGSYHYRYESGHQGNAPLIAFSPRKTAISLYLSSGFPDREDLLQQLGKHKSAKACIYIKALDDIKISVLQKMIRASFTYTHNLHR